MNTLSIGFSFRIVQILEEIVMQNLYSWVDHLQYYNIIMHIPLFPDKLWEWLAIWTESVDAYGHISLQALYYDRRLCPSILF